MRLSLLFPRRPPCSAGPAALVGLLAGAAACGDPPPPIPGFTELPEAADLRVERVRADLGKPDPDAAYWREVPAGKVALIAQPMIAPRPESVTTDAIAVQAVHDGSRVAFRLRWPDAERSEAGPLGAYSDAVAVQLPVQVDPLPPVIMGGDGMPVHIFHWRAQYQADVERGKPTVQDLYPNASIDMYAMDFRDAPGGSKAEQEMFNPGVALGNPQAFHKTAVDEIIAEGFSTSAVQAGHGADGKGTWADGFWTVVITRPLEMEGGSTLVPGQTSAVSFAVWQGGKGEVGSRKSLLMQWLTLRVSS